MIALPADENIATPANLRHNLSVTCQGNTLSMRRIRYIHAERIRGGRRRIRLQPEDLPASGPVTVAVYKWAQHQGGPVRSEERRVGKECRCRRASGQ